MLVIYGITQKLYLMSIVSFLFAGVYLLIENNAAPVSHVEVTERWIWVEWSFYNYADFEKFGIISIGQDPAFIRLYPSKRFAQMIDIPVTPEVDTVELRQFLITMLEEDKNTAISNADAIIHAMRL